MFFHHAVSLQRTWEIRVYLYKNFSLETAQGGGRKDIWAEGKVASARWWQRWNARGRAGSSTAIYFFEVYVKIQRVRKAYRNLIRRAEEVWGTVSLNQCKGKREKKGWNKRSWGTKMWRKIKWYSNYKDLNVPQDSQTRL